MKKSIIALALAVAAALPSVAQKQEGLVMTPPMGISTTLGTENVTHSVSSNATPSVSPPE